MSEELLEHKVKIHEQRINNHSERIDKLDWKDRVKQYTIQTGITLGAILIILGAYQLISLIK